MSDRDGLTQQEFDDLIRRLSHRKQENPRDRIPFQDVKDILQDEGLLESLLKEHVNGSNHSLKEYEQRHRKQRSLLTKIFAATSVFLMGLSTWGGYLVGHQITLDSVGKQSLSTQEKLNSQIQSLEAKVTSSEKQSQDYENQIKEKDTQIKYLISKVGTLSPASNTSTGASTDNSSDSSQNTSSDFDSINISLQGCRRSSKSIICSINITSKVDQVVGFGYCGSDTKTRFFDLEGSEYRASFTQLGSRVDNSGCTVETALIKEVPAKAFLVFNDIPLDVKRIKALEVSVSVKNESNTQWMNPQYREIVVK